MKEILKKLFDAKHEIGKISKDSTNPHFKNTYFDINKLLEVVEPVLSKHKLMCLQPIIDNRVITQIHDIESGDFVTSEMKLSDITDPQKRGSEITYFRRYTLQSLLSLQAEDDDANAAAQSTKQAEHPANELPWLNLTDKEGKFTKTYYDIKSRIDKGETLTMEMVKENFKVATKTKEVLNNLGIK